MNHLVLGSSFMMFLGVWFMNDSFMAVGSGLLIIYMSKISEKK